MRIGVLCLRRLRATRKGGPFPYRFMVSVCRNVVCNIDSNVGCYNSNCKQAERRDVDMNGVAQVIELYGDLPNDAEVVVSMGEIRRMWADTVKRCEVAADRPLDPYWYESSARISGVLM